MSAPEELCREQLVSLLSAQAERIACQDGQITAMAARIADLLEANEALAGKLAKLEHLLSRNSQNSSSPPSNDNGPGRTPPPEKKRPRDGPARSRGKQPGAPGANLAFTDAPDERTDRFPEGRCECGCDLSDRG